MDSSSPELGGRLVQFPVWTIGIFNPGIKALCHARHPDGELAVVLFTDDDLARQYFRQRQAPEGFALKSFSDTSALREFLIDAHALGSTHAVFDPSVGSVASSVALPPLIARLGG